MRREISEKTRKRLFYIVLIISFITIYIYNVLTPLVSDDLTANTDYKSILDFFASEYENYMTWNGRTVVQLIMRFFFLFPKSVFNIFNSACFVYLTMLIYWNIDKDKKHDFVILTLINLLIWNFGVDFAQTVLWMGGACNYLWGATIIMSMVTFFRYKTENPESIKHPVGLSVGMCILGILSGWCNENTSGGGFLLVLFTAFLFYKKNKKLQGWMISGMVGMLIGIGMMVLAPANKVRGAANKAQETHSGLMAYVARFLKINNVINEYFIVLLAVIIVVGTYLIIKKTKTDRLLYPIAFTVVGIITSYVLLMTTTPMNRAYFGAGLFLIIAAVQVVSDIPKEDVYLNTIKYGGVLLFMVFAYFSYCSNGADLMRIMRELNEREEYVTQQKALGNYDLVVPMLSEQFDNKYTFIYNKEAESNDVTEDPDSWGCSLYRTYYGLNSIVGVPRDQWTQY